MDIVAIADLRDTNRVRALHGDGNDVAVGLIKKLGREKAMSIPLHKDHNELLKTHPEVEAVVIAVPLCQHARVAIDCLKAGKHVLTEKLMAHSVTQCKEMIQVRAREQPAARRRASTALQRAVRQCQRPDQEGIAGRHQVHPRPVASQQQLSRAATVGGRAVTRRNRSTGSSRPTSPASPNEPPQAASPNLDEFLQKEFGYPSMDGWSTGGCITTPAAASWPNSAAISWTPPASSSAR